VTDKKTDKKKAKESHWYKVEALQNDEGGKTPVMEVAEGEGDQEVKAPVYQRGQFYDEHGNVVLVVAQVNMEAMSGPTLERVHQTLQAQHMAPCLVLGDHINLVKLTRMTPAEEKKARQERERKKRERDEMMEKAAGAAKSILEA
jgi:hypothetical protein